MSGASGSSKILFADQLRGLAAMSVVLTHLCGIYWFQKELIAGITFSPVQPAAVPGWVISMLSSIPVNPGPLGVSIFFLISGLVIPFSFRHNNTRSFLQARLLRIFPTYLAILAVGLLARWASSVFWGQPFSVEPLTLIANALLIHDLGAMASLDLVNWTLLIELKFYLLFAFGRGLIARWRGDFVLGLALAVFGLTLAAQVVAPMLVPRLGMVLLGLVTEAMYLPFMLLGTLMYLRLQGQIGLVHWLTTTAATLVVFAVTWKLGPSAASYSDAGVTYLWSFGAFLIFFLARRLALPLAPLRWMSAISYPFYLVHSMLGYVLLQVLTMGYGLGYAPALALAVGASLVVAWIIHLLVERPSITLGKRLGRSPAVLPPALPA
jgi:peptidoglycan/LPS O-acetylase OafA/YrhL